MADDRSYPHSPGAKGRGHTRATSEAAAESVRDSVKRLRRLALETLASLTKATPLEVIGKAGSTRESLQPRLSELVTLGFIEPTGERRRNPSGRTAAVLTLTDKGRAAL